MGGDVVDLIEKGNPERVRETKSKKGTVDS